MIWEEKADGSQKPVPAFDRWIKHTDRKMSGFVGYKPVKDDTYYDPVLGCDVINSYRAPEHSIIENPVDIDPFLEFMNYLLEEDGPFDVFIRIRKLAGFKKENMSQLGSDGNVIEFAEWVPGDGLFSGILGCHRCLSPYVAFLVILLGLVIGFLQFAPSILLVWLGLTGSTVYIFEKLGA